MRDLNFEVAHVCPSFVVIHIYNIFTIYLNIVTLQMIKTLGKKASKSGDSVHDRKYMEQSNIRVIKKTLVFVNGIPSHLNHPELLKKKQYFGRYGCVKKIVLNSQHSRKTDVTQAYVTYSNQLEASIAIMALNDFYYDERPLKVSFGTTKYCTFFLKGLECTNTECCYLHAYDQQKQVNHKDPQTVFEEQNQEAENVVCANLRHIVKQMLIEKESDQGFPTFHQLVDFLVDSQFVKPSEIEKQKQRIQKKPLQTFLNIKQIPRQNEKESAVSSPKLLKNNSFSTMAGSPQKAEEQSKQGIERIEKYEKIGQTQNQPIEHKKQEQIQNIQRQKIETSIERLVIKKIFQQQGQCQSKMNFAKNDKRYHEEYAKMKHIVQRYLVRKA